MDDLEDVAWIVWCALLSALLFYILVQTVRYCAKIAKARGLISDTNPDVNASEDFTSPVYTISSRTMPSIDTISTTASNRELTSRSSLNIDSANNNMEKSDGLPTYEEALRIMMTPTCPVMESANCNSQNSQKCVA
ncbi:uncharacterized protein LOC134831354 isoform X2 [Culicoides brevitarsis]|uniref:uncharacterized protein LOC134831354 isoform X2 n=1 Tax=Culicoides brevitarsis TaxID=469753 RepID=UPI00307BE4CF